MRPITRIHEMCELLRKANAPILVTLQKVYGNYANDAILEVTDDDLLDYLSKCYETPLDVTADPITNLEGLWTNYADLRLGQLIGNFITFTNPFAYYKEDEPACGELQALLKQMKNSLD